MCPGGDERRSAATSLAVDKYKRVIRWESQEDPLFSVTNSILEAWLERIHGSNRGEAIYSHIHLL
jgi:hypothetical protein